VIEGALAVGAEQLTLEVRMSNTGAQDLYRRFGFVPGGARKAYYSDNGEDALVMWAHDIATPEYRERLDAVAASVPGSTTVEAVEVTERTPVAAAVHPARTGAAEGEAAS
jgi:hypothetical protein